MFIPSFTCKYCGKQSSAQMATESSGCFVPCDCKEARDASEREHRARIELHKQRKAAIKK